MGWCLMTAGTIGFLLGLRFHILALVAASGLTSLLCLAFVLIASASLTTALLLTFGALTALQLGYLAGAALSRRV